MTGLGFAPGPVDGDFGQTTEVAVRAFQSSRGLDVDGICGPDTWHAVVEAGHHLGDRLLYLHSPMMRGDDIADLQQRLAGFGFDPGRVDSILGPETANALTEFQRNTGLVADGIAGPETIKMFARLTTRTPSTNSTVSAVREVERIRGGPRTLQGCRIVVGEPGGLGAVAAAIHRVLGDLGAEVVTLHHPDWETQAARANSYEADAFVGLVVRDDGECSTCFFMTDRSESVAGRALAEELSRSLGPVLGDVATRGMRLPVLRATKMPAVVCRLGRVPSLVPNTAKVARAIHAGLERWIEAGAEPSASRERAAVASGSGPEQTH